LKVVKCESEDDESANRALSRNWQYEEGLQRWVASVRRNNSTSSTNNADATSSCSLTSSATKSSSANGDDLSRQAGRLYYQRLYQQQQLTQAGQRVNKSKGNNNKKVVVQCEREMGVGIGLGAGGYVFGAGAGGGPAAKRPQTLLPSPKLAKKPAKPFSAMNGE
jgi:hypothetical protein